MLRSINSRLRLIMLVPIVYHRLRMPFYSSSIVALCFLDRRLSNVIPRPKLSQLRMLTRRHSRFNRLLKPLRRTRHTLHNHGLSTSNHAFYCALHHCCVGGRGQIALPVKPCAGDEEGDVVGEVETAGNGDHAEQDEYEGVWVRLAMLDDLSKAWDSLGALGASIDAEVEESVRRTEDELLSWRQHV